MANNGRQKNYEPCGAKTRKGERCGNPPVPGHYRCRLHGGLSPGAEKTIERNLRRKQMENAAATLGLPRDIDPGRALLEEVHRAAGHVSWLSSVVGDLERQEVVRGVSRMTSRTTDEGEERTTVISAEINTWIRLYNEERDRLVRVSKAAIDVGIAERQVRLAEQQGALLAGVINEILGDLKLTEEQRRAAPEIVQRRLIAVADAEEEMST